MKAKAFTFPAVNRVAGLMLTLALLLVSASAVRGAVRTWTGGYVSGYWSASANWDTGAPQPGDDLIFPAGVFGVDLISTNNTGNITYRSISISGDGYVLRGGGSGETIALTHGLRSTAAGTSNTVELNIDLATSQSFNVGWIDAELFVNGDVDLGSYTLTILGAGQVRLGGVISGTGGITKSGSGTHWLEGPSGNTYTGATLVHYGTLELAKTSGDAIPSGGSLTIGNNTAPADSAIVREQASYQIAHIPITINRDGWLDVGDYLDTVGAITFNGGHAGSSATGRLNLGGNVTVNPSSEEAIFDGNLYMGSGTRTFAVPDGPSGFALRITAVVSGGGLLMTGDGTMLLSGANTYTGVTTVNEGALYVSNDNALGATFSGTTIGNAAFIQLAYVDVGEEPLTLGRTTGGGVFRVVGNCSWAGDIVLDQDAVFITNIGNVLELSGAISGPGGITFDGSGMLVLSGTSANSYSGDTRLNNGWMDLNKPGGLAIAAGHLIIGDGVGFPDSNSVRAQANYQIAAIPITIHRDGWLDVDAFTDGVGPITFHGGHAGSSTGLLGIGGDVTVNASSDEAILSGNVAMDSGTQTFDVENGSAPHDLLCTAVLSGNGLLKTGNGTLTLQGANTHTGPTTVNEGLLNVGNDNAFGATGSGSSVTDSGYLLLQSVDVGTEPLTLGRTAGGPVIYASGSSSWAGTVVLDEDAILNSSGTLELSGVISGPGGITFNGPGTLRLSSATWNTFLGDTTVNQGVLELAAPNVIRHGTLTVGNHVGGQATDIVRFHSDYPIYNNVHVVINSDGWIDFNGYSDSLRFVLFDRGRITTGAGVFTMKDNVTAIESFNTNWTASITGNMDLPVEPHYFDIDENVSFNLAAQITGRGGIAKWGDGSLFISGANSYSGSTFVVEGRLYVENDLSLGHTQGGTRVTDGAALVLRFDTNVGDEALELNGTGHSTLGALASIYGNNSWAGPVTIASATRLTTFQSSDVLELGGAIGGTGDVTVAGGGTVVYSGPDTNTCTGDTNVDEGTLVLSKTSYNGAIAGHLHIGDGGGGADADVVLLRNLAQISDTKRVTIATSGLFDMNNQNEDVGSLGGGGRVRMGTGDLGTGADDTSATYSGLIEGSGSLLKTGGGMLTLTGNNPYTGHTEIKAGTLLVNGSQPFSDVMVLQNGRLGGIGTVGEIDSIGAVAPGASAGELSSSTVALQAGSAFEIELDGHLPADYDQLHVNGDVKLADTPDLSISWGFVPAEKDEFTILENDGVDAVIGTFNGLPEGASVVAGNVTLDISYVGGTGNDVVLTATDVDALEPLALTAIDLTDGGVDLEWAGGVPFFVVETNSSLLSTGTWHAATTPTREFMKTLPATLTNEFFRVRGGN